MQVGITTFQSAGGKKEKKKETAGTYSKAPNSNLALGIHVSLTCARGLMQPVV
jgi:hypothetical protein